MFYFREDYCCGLGEVVDKLGEICNSIWEVFVFFIEFYCELKLFLKNFL